MITPDAWQSICDEMNRETRGGMVLAAAVFTFMGVLVAVLFILGFDKLLRAAIDLAAKAAR